jgi:hypothetical protein
MTYEDRVSTSVCDSNPRGIISPNAIQTFGAKVVRIRKRFDGRCVNTIVLISPNRLAKDTAANCEAAEHRLVTKTIAPTVATPMPNRSPSQIRIRTAHMGMVRSRQSVSDGHDDNLHGQCGSKV